jgi:DNA-binding protein H-NS
VPAKYRDPATGDSWSGRGLQPKWLKAALTSGRRIDDFKL